MSVSEFARESLKPSNGNVITYATGAGSAVQVLAWMLYLYQNGLAALPFGAVRYRLLRSLDMVAEWPPTAGPSRFVVLVKFVQAGVEMGHGFVTSRE